MAALPITEWPITGNLTTALSCCLAATVLLTPACTVNAHRQAVVMESQDLEHDVRAAAEPSRDIADAPATQGDTDRQHDIEGDEESTVAPPSANARPGVEEEVQSPEQTSPTIDVFAHQQFFQQPEANVDDGGGTSAFPAQAGDGSPADHGVSVATTYSPFDQRSRVRFHDDGVQRDAVDFNVKAKLAGNLTGEAQMASSGFDSQTDKTFNERRNRLLRVRVAGDFSGMNYGVEYRSIGQGFKRAPGMNWRLDQEGTETWVERKFGWVGVKGLLNEYANNVELDPRRPRTTTVLAGSALTFGTSSTPVLTLAYLQGTSEKGGGPLGARVQQSTVQQYTASLYYWAPKWEASMSSTYMPSQDRMHSEYQTESLYYDAAFTIRPTDNLTITPTVSLQTERYRWNGKKSETPMAMLTLMWNSVAPRLDFYSFGMYMRSFSTDGWMDTKMTYIQNSLRYDIGKERGQRFLSFDVIYNRYADAVYRIGNTEEVLGRVLFTVTRL
jgi:hypothetical protein